MSLDAEYILYYCLLDDSSTMEKDKQFLKNEYGGYFFDFSYGRSFYWEKPKHLLLPEDLGKLGANQILEKQDCDIWRQIK